MIIDLAHASNRVIDEVLEMAGDHVVVSHTGVQGSCNNPRSLSDQRVKKIAEAGGVLGIAMFEKAVCGKAVRDVARAIRYVSDLAGEDCVSLGTDFDGAVTAPLDVTGLPALTRELLAQGFDERQLAKIMGGNALRVFRRVLPQG